MEQESFSYKFHDKDLVDLEINFRKSLDEVQEKHIDFFKGRPSKTGNTEHDIIQDNIITEIENRNLKWYFKPDGNLTNEIQQDCIKIWNRLVPQI